MFSSDLVLFLYKYHLILIAGIAGAIILAKFKFSWLAYLAGLVGEFIPMWNDYRLLSLAGYGYAMSGVMGGFVLIAIMGAIVVAICRKKQKNKQQAGEYVVYFCPICKGTHAGNPGEAQGCPVCHKPTRETSVLNQQWEAMSEAEKAQLKQSWDMES